MTNDNPQSELPFVSICLLTYNRAQALHLTLDSLIRQTHGNFELIINDDRSTDDTERVCREYERADGRIRYVKNETNLRYAGNQNAALSRAQSDYCAIVHDGDVYVPHLIESWTKALMEHRSAAFVFNSLECINREGTVVSDFAHPFPPCVRGIDLLDHMLRVTASPIFGIVMVRKSCVEHVGPFDENLPVLADVDMWMRLLLEFDAAYIREPLIRVAPREIGHHNNFTNWRVASERDSIYARNVRRRHPEGGPKAERLLRQVEVMTFQDHVVSLISCLKHGKIGAFLRGVNYLRTRKTDVFRSAEGLANQRVH
jgi:glycosyltransferase involved in cell wall biosynthesis